MSEKLTAEGVGTESARSARAKMSEDLTPEGFRSRTLTHFFQCMHFKFHRKTSWRSESFFKYYTTYM